MKIVESTKRLDEEQQEMMYKYRYFIEECKYIKRLIIPEILKTIYKSYILVGVF